MDKDDRDATWHYEQIKRLDEFTVTEEHLALARRVNIGWRVTDWAEGPGFDLKRPYGNSDRHRDIAEVVDGAFLNAMGEGAQGDYIQANSERWNRLHAEMGVVVQIFLTTLQISPGRYRRQFPGDWAKTGD